MNNETSKKYGKLINDFNQKINRIPIAIEDVNPKIDFSNGRHQEVMIDIEFTCRMLSCQFHARIGRIFQVHV